MILENANLILTASNTELWDDTEETDPLTKAMGGHAKWHVEVRGFGWRKRSGFLDVAAMTGHELITAILPETECTFKVYVDGDKIAINNVHHDQPEWNVEWYTIARI